MSSRTNVLGVDPSQRHTGLCFLSAETPPLFHEIKPTGDILSSAGQIRAELRAFIAQMPHDFIWSVEKQLSVGGQSSTLQFFVQMQILEIIKERAKKGHEPRLVFPLPVQLQSYVIKKQGCPKPKGRALVDFYKEQTGNRARISEHLVDAYYLARLGQDVLAGVWTYNLSQNEAPIHPWRVINGS